MPIPSNMLASLAAMPGLVESAVRSFPAPHLHWEPESWGGIPGERFSLAGQICHLRDIEVDGYHERIRRMLSEDAPSLVSLDGYDLAVQRGYQSADPEEALRAFRSARAATLAMLASLAPADLSRRGTFAEYGEITLYGLICYLSSHDYQHLACLDWLAGKLHAGVEGV